jgi:hypothetical protein
MRNRLEDLGRLAVLIDNVLDMSVFDIVDNPKRCFDNFFDLDRDQQENILHDLAYGLDGISNALGDCLTIARGTDELNDDVI